MWKTHRPAQAGFTLIEIMIVIAIIAAVLAMGAPRLLNTATQKRTAIRKLSVATREIRNVARLTSSTNRIVLQLDDKKGHAYWVESAPGNATILSEEQQEELDKMTESQRGDEAPKTHFNPDTRVVRKAVQLPRGLFIESVEYAAREKDVTGGNAYIHFFPSGLSEDAAIHLTDRKTMNWTITIHPLTGRAQVFERKVSLRELK